MHQRGHTTQITARWPYTINTQISLVYQKHKALMYMWHVTKQHRDCIVHLLVSLSYITTIILIWWSTTAAQWFFSTIIFLNSHLPVLLQVRQFVGQSRVEIRMKWSQVNGRGLSRQSREAQWSLMFILYSSWCLLSAAAELRWIWSTSPHTRSLRQNKSPSHHRTALQNKSVLER